MQTRPFRLAATAALAAVFLFLPARTSHAQDVVAGPGTEPVQVPDSYLAPLKAIDSDEDAFVDQLWSMGQVDLDHIQAMQRVLVDPKSTPDEAAKAARELARSTAQLEVLCQYGIERYSNNARVRNLHGTILYDALGKPLEGVQEWHAAVSIDSKYADPYNNLGMHYFHSGNYALGFSNMDRALELEPKNPDFCFNMAQNYLIYRPQTESHRNWSAEKVYKEAMKLSKKATKLAPDDFQILQDYAVNFQTAENFGVVADWKEAAKAWKAARPHARTDVDRFFTWLNEGRAWREMGNKEDALRCFKEALAINPKSEVTQRNISSLESGE